MVRSSEGLWSELTGWTSENPTKHSIESNWSTRGSDPLALQQGFNEDINSEQEIDSPRVPKVWVSKRKIVEVVPCVTVNG